LTKEIKMKECLLYTNAPVNKPSFSDVNCNSREILDKPLIVNCAGCTNTDIWCINYNKTGRLDYYFLYLISSDFLVENPSGSKMMHEGELVVLPPKMWYKMTPDKEKTIYYLCVHITGYDVENMLKEYGIEIFPKINKLSREHNLEARFKRLFDAFAKNDEYRDRELAILAERIFIEAGRAIKLHKEDRIALSKSIRHINEYYSSGIRITELAKMENMSMTAYNKEFKEQMGMAPTKYIIKLRMDLAKELLETTTLSIKEISLMCGYTDFNFFSRAFKENTGVSPTEYRKTK
jgi:AraC-like DNA-binding protein